jgi:hypothetical protein
MGTEDIVRIHVKSRVDGKKSDVTVGAHFSENKWLECLHHAMGAGSFKAWQKPTCP